MKIFDSHCHLTDKSYRDDFDAVLQRMAEAEVAAAMLVGITRTDSEATVALAESRDNLIASVGIHPHDAQHATEADMERLRELAARPDVRAWGETGLDFNRMFSPQKDQEHWLRRQLEIADDLELPLIFHERDSEGRFLEILRERYPSGRDGVVHCFGGTMEEMFAYLELGLHIGITGILTVKGRGADLREMAPEIPADRILVETDAPYLTPVPERNKHRRNEPAFVRTTLLRLAQVRKEDPEALADTVWNNTCRLFRYPEKA
ncbi:MAG: TatD family hydrolase [Desulfococcaceae bacterium]